MATLLDVLLGLAFALTALAGFRNGFFRELFSLGGLGLGAVAAIRFTGGAVERIGLSFFRTDLGAAVVFVVLFLVVFALAVLAGTLLAKVWEGSSPGIGSRLIGLFLGALRGYLLVVVLGGALVLLAEPGSQTLASSRLLPWLSPGIHAALPLLPGDLDETLAERWEALPFAPSWKKEGISI